MNNTRSPIKEPPMHNPGQSANHQIYGLLTDKVVTWLLVALFMGMGAALEWYRWTFDLKPSPWLFTFMAVVMASLGSYKIPQPYKLSIAPLADARVADYHLPHDRHTLAILHGGHCRLDEPATAGSDQLPQGREPNPA